MRPISRRKPGTNITRLIVINGFKTGLDIAPAGSITLPLDITTNLPTVHQDYNSLYYAVDQKEGIVSIKVRDKNDQQLRLTTITLDYLRVLRYTVNRSIVFKDNKWVIEDLSFYNLDETGGNLPDINTDEVALIWANHIVNGDSNRLNIKPSAGQMTNPSSSEVGAEILLMQGAQAQLSLANMELGSARSALDQANVTIDNFIQRAWDFLEANFSHLEAPAKRNMLRQFGVIYITTGIPNRLTFLVKNTSGNALPEATATIEQSGSEAIANNEGRVDIQTNVLGPITIVVQYPGKQKARIEFTIPDDAEEQTFTLPDVILEDNV